MKKALIIEDDQDFREILKREFLEHDFNEVEIIDTLNEVESLSLHFTHIVVDLRLKKFTGLDFIPLLRKKYPDAGIVMLTAFGSIATSVQAIKLGADNYVMKPCQFDELMLAFDAGKIDEQEDEIDKLPDLYKKEREYIEYVLSLHNGNITKAAESLGIRRQSLQRKLNKYPLKD